MRKLFVIIFLFFIGVLNVDASTITYERTKQNLGVNKNILITADRKNDILRTPLVNADEKIYDYADFFSQVEEDNLYHEIKAFIDETQMDMVVLTTKLSVGIEEYVNNFYNYNDFGIDFEHYSGILLIIDKGSYNNTINIYTFGDAKIYYNVHRLDDISGEINKNIRKEKFSAAASLFVNESLRYYKKDIPYSNRGAYIDENGNIAYNFVAPYKLAFIIAIIITVFTMIVLINKNKMVKKATEAKDYLDEDSIKLYICSDKLLDSNKTENIKK